MAEATRWDMPEEDIDGSSVSDECEGTREASADGAAKDLGQWPAHVPGQGQGQGTAGGDMVPCCTRFIRSCPMCKESSAHVRWFEEDTIVEGGRLVRVPKHDWCFLCGTTGEAWPLEFSTDAGRAAMADRHYRQSAFRMEFNNVRNIAQSLVVRMMREAAVKKRTSCGMRIEIDAAFVTQAEFEKHFGQPCESVGLEVHHVTGPGNVRIGGCILSLHDLPSTCPRYIVKLYTDVERTLIDTLLSPQDILREGQARERFQLACSQASTQRGKRDCTSRYWGVCKHGRFPGMEQPRGRFHGESVGDCFPIAFPHPKRPRRCQPSCRPPRLLPHLPPNPTQDLGDGLP